MSWTSASAWCLMAAGMLALGGCTSSGAQRIVGPDGTAMAHVHCGSDQGICFRLAGELCPSGYDLRPVLTGYDGNFLVRCRAPRPTVAAASPAACSLPSPAVASARQAWPLSGEPWPSVYPWPPPETSAAVQPSPTTAPSSTPPELDLGY
jgi:hypothetical protein